MAMATCLPTFVEVNVKDMETKQTVAIVGLPNPKYNDLIVKLAEENCRLLLIKRSANDEDPILPKDFSGSQNEDVEVLSCAKDGCWEADVIVLLGEESYERPFIERIKEVSTQKLVVGFSVADQTSETVTFEATNLQQLLPNSKVVHVYKNIGSDEVLVAGDHAQSNQTVAGKIRTIGYSPEIVDGFSSIVY